MVLVATLRSLKANSGVFDIKPGQPLPAEILDTNIPLLSQGCANLKWHINNAKSYGLPVVVAVNCFPDDCPEELAFLADYALSAGAIACEISEAFAKGGAGTTALAQRVIDACAHASPLVLAYPDNASLAQKIEILAQRYGPVKSLSPHKHVNSLTQSRRQVLVIYRCVSPKHRCPSAQMPA